MEEMLVKIIFWGEVCIEMVPILILESAPKEKCAADNWTWTGCPFSINRESYSDAVSIYLLTYMGVFGFEVFSTWRPRY